MRILIIHRDLPFPADNGGRLRRAHVLRYLARHHEVALACFGDPDEIPDFPDRDKLVDLKVVPLPPRPPWGQRVFSRLPSEVLHLKSREMAQYVTSTVDRFDPHVILAGEPSLTQYLENHDACLRVLDYVMVLTLSAERYGAIAGGVGAWLWKVRWHKLAAFHRQIAPRYDLCLVNSIEDRTDLMTTGDWRKVEFIPNGLELAEYPMAMAEVDPNTLIYPGSITYPPNRDAVKYFIEEILPLIRHDVPEARLVVTGAVPEDGSAPQGPGVEYSGYVPDVRPVISGANVCVVPLRSGAGGTRFKVLEAMALGTPVVSTDIGAEGVELTPDRNIFIANEPREFAEKTVRLLQSAELRSQTSHEGRGLIEDIYSWDHVGARITGMLRELYEVKSPGKALESEVVQNRCAD